MQLFNRFFLKLGFTPFSSKPRNHHLVVVKILSNRKVFLFLLLSQIFFALSVFSQNSTNRDRDNQFRTEFEIVVPLYKGLHFFFDSDLRLGRFSKTRFVRPGAGFVYKQKFGKFFAVEPGYRYRSLHEFSGKREGENILFVNGKVKFKVRKFEISQNNLIEFRFRDSGNSWRYRPRLKISRPVKIGATKIDLFVSNEVYYEGKDRAWTRNRFKIGFGKDINKNADFEIYYMRQNDSFSRPGDLHIFGVAFGIETKRWFDEK